MTILLHQLRFEQRDLLAKPRGGGVRLHLPAPPLRASRVGVRRRDRRRSRRRRPSRRASSATARRRPPSAGSRSSSSVAARRACSSGCARPRCRRGSYLARRPALHARDLRAPVGRPPRARRARVRREHARELARLRGCRRPRRRLLRGLGFGSAALIRSAEGVSAVVNVVDPADGVPLRLVRTDVRLPGRPAGDRGRPAADVLPRHRQRRLPRRRVALRRPDCARHRARAGAPRASSSRYAGSAGCRARGSEPQRLLSIER